MSNLPPATLALYTLTNSSRSMAQGSNPLSSTALNTALIDSSTGSSSLALSPVSLRVLRYPSNLSMSASLSAIAL